MKKSILVTGASGAGKTTTCEELEKQGYAAYGIEDMEGLFNMIDKDTGEVFRENDNDDLEVVRQRHWICDVEKLKELIDNEKSDIAFYCGTASNIYEIWPLFDKVMYLKADEEALRERLSLRKPGDFGRKREIQDWMFGGNGLEKEEREMREKGAIIIDSNRDVEKVAEDVAKIAKN